MFIDQASFLLRPQDALGEEVLDEHFLDGEFGEIGIERSSADGDELAEGVVVFRVFFARLFQDRGEGFAQGGDDVLEVRDGGFPLGDGFGGKFEELLRTPSSASGWSSGTSASRLPC